MHLTKITTLLAMALASVVGASAANIKEEAVDYTVDGTVCEGWHAYDASKAEAGKLPGVLIIHQWTGLTDYEKMRARMLAELGYNVFAADIYGKGIRPKPPEAGKEAGKFKNDRALYRKRLNAGLDELRKDPHSNPADLAVIGYCFGGTGALELARSGADVKGVVTFHGGLDSPTPADGKNIKGQVLILHGADDPHVPPADVAACEKELAEAGVKYKLIKYPGAVHSFTQKSAGNDNSKGSAYNEAADKASWKEMETFLAKVLK